MIDGAHRIKTNSMSGLTRRIWSSRLRYVEHNRQTVGNFRTELCSYAPYRPQGR